ncbi:helix-turn-helix domain-containing protein [Salmonella enterica]|nr:helix-turn-helix domain-containing protein [Salmonella enterica]EEP1654103.1 helix-turn-helix domain-containing protein [Salmonella enterica subsp. enterica serovar Newport]OXX92866.1 endoribonuclease L-PSP [Salmonella enterica subsp. enterica serovar Newport str. CVM79_1357]EEC6321047.1 helix-turn-helix domain-containing protein [Salmonella enterica]EEC6748976.1 helix-turn-helix domain-containing protein [Salmonella enterica]
MAIHDAGMFTVKKTNRLKILQDVIDRNLRPGQAAEMLSITPRHCSRLLKRYRQLGPLGMNNHSRGRVGNRLLPTSLIDQALCIIRFVSGQVGSHTDGTPEPDFQKQVRLAFENLKATLTAAGCTFDDIVDVTTFHTDPEQQLNDVMAVKQEIFAHPPYPNWTAVGVTWLAGFDFEIKVIARIP